ncbi:hypothetical protein [Methylobacterium nodulans]|uniref:hypothetical protein n=1 Tax=Methylobacterium nodulans TaxID=114616 RepID=UPI0018DB9FA0|nr:hypothetical protein [Methylobacterium nodulans]
MAEAEQKIAEHFHFVPPDHRAAEAGRLIEWWDRRIVYSLCGERERVIVLSLRAALLDRPVGNEGILTSLLRRRERACTGGTHR